MKRTFVFLLLLVSLAVPALAAESTPAASPVVEAPATAPAVAATAETPAATVPVRTAKRVLTPLQVAMNAVIESEQAQMAALKARLSATKDHAAAEAVQREIEQLKTDTEVQLLSLQATNHRQNGRVAAATQLEESVRSLRAAQSAKMLSPQRPAVPAVTAR
ncbi:MAG: hypothetical protein HZA61_17160 [Candidatus Eisenbacteria bacterium]|uniref:Uncharacterized protein n=1 Tax=Eiseniibacteriota bacterium TaxID=2212470 RepID=A0A933SJX1_UNCEI|nr:hypothetical protein [Candidatus Eisenbacteria bacterium]